jgi:DNA-binding transcriptional LysR family regulator
MLIRYIVIVDIRQLRYFVACVEEGSILAGAKRLRIAQPALSRQIRDLEASLGCHLLDRDSRGVRLTSAGAGLYRDAVALLDSVAGTEARVRRLGADQERAVRFGAARTSSKFDFLGRGLAAFRAAHPHTPVEIQCATTRSLLSAMLGDRLDLAVMYQQAPDARRYGERTIHREAYVLAAHPTHRLVQREAIHMADLVGEPLVWLARTSNPDNYDRLLQQCRRSGLEPVIAYQADSQDEQFELLSISGGVCFTPASRQISEPAGKILFKEIKESPIELQFRLVWRKDLKGSPAWSLLDDLNREIDAHQSALREGALAWARMPGGAPVAWCD